jgi:hypothetical protein
MRIPCKITIELKKLIQVAKMSLKQECRLTISTNNPNRVQISDLLSPMTSFDVKMRALYVYLYKIMTLNSLLGKKQDRPSQFKTKIQF